MADVIENTSGNVVNGEAIPSNGKANAGLTLGIIGTSLAGLMALGGLGSVTGLFGNKSTSSDATSTAGFQSTTLTNQELYLERSQCQNYIDITKQYYQGKLDSQREFAQLFFDAYDRDVKNSFDLYKYSRDNKDELAQKISDVDKKVDVMAAIRPYQDALINAKIDNNALMDDYKLCKRTCRMIEGELVLPSTPVITGYGSYSPYTVNNTTTTATT